MAEQVVELPKPVTVNTAALEGEAFFGVASMSPLVQVRPTETAAVGPAGEYVVSLPADRQETLREEYRHRLSEPTGALTLSARAWAARGRVPA